ncbi:MAG: phenylalanine--tRNA ligase subunit beta, partial [Clostridia bacterium]|nr:phenylalanine--tRNA ligase subunit beta [Clostridia bacterium]
YLFGGSFSCVSETAPSMVETIVRNLRRGNTDGKLFEIAKIYISDQIPPVNLPEEKNVLCIGIFGGNTFFDIKGILEDIADSLNIKFGYAPARRSYLHPGICAEVSCDGEILGCVGRLDPQICEELAIEKKVFIAEIDYDALMRRAKPFKYVPLSKFPEAQRDLALVSDISVTCGQIESEIYSACKYVTGVKLFDIYIGKQLVDGKKSMAFTVTFTPKDEAFTPERLDGFVKKILGNLKHKLNIELR